MDSDKSEVLDASTTPSQDEGSKPGLEEPTLVEKSPENDVVSEESSVKETEEQVSLENGDQNIQEVSDTEKPESPSEPDEPCDKVCDPAAVSDAQMTPSQESSEQRLEEPTQPEKSPAALEGAEELPVNDNAQEEPSTKETDEPLVLETGDQGSQEVLDSTEKSELPSKPVGPCEKVSDPAAVLDTEPENLQQPPVPENSPELPLLQTHLDQGVSEPQPEKSAEPSPVTEVQEQMSQSVAVTQQQQQPETKEEQTSEEPQPAEMKEPAQAEVKAEVSPEEPVKAEVSPEEPAKKEAVNECEVGKEVGSVKTVESGDAGSVEPHEEPQREKDVVPAPGSLAFALLDQERTKDALKASRVLVVLRGLPGSGKSFLARAIADVYTDLCSVVSADAHGIKPESPEACADGYKALDDAVVASCRDSKTSSLLIVVDDTNHAHGRLARLAEIAEEHRLVAIYLEPQTEWSRDVVLLAKKTKRGLTEAELTALKGPLEETVLPLFFGWFLFPAVEEKIRCTTMDFLKTLDTLDAFKKHLTDFTGKAEQEVDLEQYFEPKGPLHCTTKFCDYGKAEGSKEYWQNSDVRKAYGSVFELSLTALFVTPRTVGAAVSLTEEQLLLWPDDSDKEGKAEVPESAELPAGSRAHITLGCAKGVEPVQTGLDLLQILALQQKGQQGEPTEMELGSLVYYSEGRWVLTLREPVCALACFSSFYSGKESEPTKKDPEKKKKPKCAIL